MTTIHDESRSVPINPFSKPIVSLEREIMGMDWQFPYLAQVVQLVAILAVTAVCVLLYCTIGVVSQVSESFRRLIRDSQQQIGDASLMERSAFGIAILVYGLVFLPAFLVQVPFLCVGWLWARLGWLMTVVSLVLTALVALALLYGAYAGWFGPA